MASDNGNEQPATDITPTLTTRQAAGLQALLDLADNDLLDLLLARNEPVGDLDRNDVHEVLALSRYFSTNSRGCPPTFIIS